MAMKFRAHETFFIRKGWISKGMRYVLQKPNVFTDKNENPMDVLGVGANMVKSLRYWLQAIGLTKEPKTGKKEQSLTEFGKLVHEHDPYTEELGTLQLLHYKLVTDEEMAPSWYYFFNKFSMKEFSKDDFLAQIQNELKMKGVSVAIRSLTDDFTCIINTYVPRYKSDTSTISPENNINCPFGELGFIDIIRKEHGNFVYKKSIPIASNFNPWVVMAIIADQAGDREEIGLNELLSAEKNIGKVFNLDSICMLSLLHEVEKLGVIRIIRTAGLDVVRILEKYSFVDCVANYYADIEEVSL